MSNDEKLIKVTTFNVALNKIIGSDFREFSIFKSKGLLSHLLKRKHYTAAKYIDYLSDIVSKPDYIGLVDEKLEFVKCYNDNIYVCVKLDNKSGKHYIATMFEVKRAKIENYVKAGKWHRVDV